MAIVENNSDCLNLKPHNLRIKKQAGITPRPKRVIECLQMPRQQAEGIKKHMHLHIHICIRQHCLNFITNIRSTSTSFPWDGQHNTPTRLLCQ